VTRGTLGTVPMSLKSHESHKKRLIFIEHSNVETFELTYFPFTIMNNTSLYNWQRISFFNLLLVSVLGVTLRYKILFPLPFIDQKFLLHAHSHFAFDGWITQILMAFIVKYLHERDASLQLKKYNWLLRANLICAYGMLLSFPFQGYGAVSITFSTLSIFVSYAFAISVWRDLNRLSLKSVSHHWFKASFVFNAISSLGVFSLAFMMANKILNQNFYLAAVYFFLHFQYNGWFFFACMGLLHAYMVKKKIFPSFKATKTIFWLFFSASIPAYFLSALWLPIPTWIYIVVVVAAVSQCVGYAILVKHIINVRQKLVASITQPAKWLWLLVSIALSIKLSLQLISVVPALSQLTVGFRPIVIGYLHLVLLGVITIFLFGYFVVVNQVQQKAFFKGVTIFVTGIIINEVLLMLQGITALTYTNVPYINESLFAAALVMFTGLLILNSALKKSVRLNRNSSRKIGADSPKEKGFETQYGNGITLL